GVRARLAGKPAQLLRDRISGIRGFVLGRGSGRSGGGTGGNPARRIPARAGLILGAPEVTPNPKLNNLLIPYEQAEHDLLLVSDSNMRVPRWYLRRMVGHLRDDVGVVTAVVSGRWAESWG